MYFNNVVQITRYKHENQKERAAFLWFQIYTEGINMKTLAKKGNTAMTYVGSIIGLVVLFLVVAELYPELTTAGASLNASGIPFGSFFVAGGIVTILLAVGILFVAMRAVKK